MGECFWFVDVGCVSQSVSLRSDLARTERVVLMLMICFNNYVMGGKFDCPAGFLAGLTLRSAPVLPSKSAKGVRCCDVWRTKYV